LNETPKKERYAAKRFDVYGARFCILATRFNETICNNLIEGATRTLQEHGIRESDIDLIRAPGAFELPLAAQRIAKGGQYDAIIAVATIIRGGTPHFEFVSGACTDGLLRVTLDYQLPLGFCVLTTDDVQQAVDRSGANDDNKGREAALATLEMVSLFRELKD
jgi:6,7-dimethyl-8-ribityllumazine synthase